MLTVDLCASALSVGSMFGAAMGGGGVSIDFDRTFIAQMVLFSLLVVVLKPLLFDPVLKVFEQREVRTEGAKGEAREMQEKAGVLLRKYEKKLEEVNQVAAEERDRLRSETAKLEGEILEEAREATNRIVDEGRKKIAEDISAIRFDLGKQSERIARDVASRVLGREVS